MKNKITKTIILFSVFLLLILVFSGCKKSETEIARMENLDAINKISSDIDKGCAKIFDSTNHSI